MNLAVYAETPQIRDESIMRNKRLLEDVIHVLGIRP
jgi:hypothetical protein